MLVRIRSISEIKEAPAVCGRCRFDTCVFVSLEPGSSHTHTHTAASLSHRSVSLPDPRGGPCAAAAGGRWGTSA